MPAPRLLPSSNFPAFAYVPGRRPRPAPGHVVAQASGWDQFEWGMDLFNHGYYWEAHEAWEALWTAAKRGTRRRALLKGLILLSAAGLKARQGTPAGTRRHAARAELSFRELADAPGTGLRTVLGLSPSTLAEFAEAAKVALCPGNSPLSGGTQIVFAFELALEARVRSAPCSRIRRGSAHPA
jgi:uncharacterized protein